MSNFYEYTRDEILKAPKKKTYPCLSEPILLFNRFRIYEVCLALGVTIVFGVIQGWWILTFSLIVFILIALPKLRAKYPIETLYRIYLDRYSKLPIGPFTWGHIQIKRRKINEQTVEKME